jgi:hypothetical protein
MMIALRTSTDMQAAMMLPNAKDYPYLFISVICKSQNKTMNEIAEEENRTDMPEGAWLSLFITG